MKKLLWLTVPLLIPVAAWGGQVTVNQSGSGNFTTIQAAITSGATNILITDSGQYFEDLQIGDPSLIVGGPPTFLGANHTGTNRPVITPVAGHSYTDSKRSGQNAGFGLFANNSVVSNLIIEANPDAGSGGAGSMMIMATNVVVANCKFRIAATNQNGTATFGTLGSGSPLIMFAQQGDGIGGVTPGGPNCDGCLVLNSEFLGVSEVANPLEPIEGPNNTDGGWGYLGQPKNFNGTGQGSGYVRLDHYSVAGVPVTVTLEGCYFHYDQDYGIFPTDNQFTGPENITVVCKRCRFDANGKFELRGRGANVVAQDSIFTRPLQADSADNENAAFSIHNNGGNDPFGVATNCLFVNCGSADYKRAYAGAVQNYNSAGLMSVNQCTFVDCVNGVTCAAGGLGGGGNPPLLAVTNCIFHQIGNNVPRSVDAAGITLTNGSPELVGGQYPAWTNGLPVWIAQTDLPSTNTAVFNDFRDLGQITIDNCMVGAIASEDASPWQPATVTGSRLYAGSDSDFVGQGTVTRATPVFRNQNPDALNPFQLDPSSPGLGLGANLAPILEPKLAFTVAGSTLTISWTEPIWVTGYALESTASLATPSWSPVAGVLDAGGGSYTVPVSIGSANQYFAIRQLP